jgi:hypothetical protein
MPEPGDLLLGIMVGRRGDLAVRRATSAVSTIS